jgi:hypothetical protein
MNYTTAKLVLSCLFHHKNISHFTSLHFILASRLKKLSANSICLFLITHSPQTSQRQSQNHITTVSQPVWLGVKFTLGLVTRYYFLSEICCVVFVGRPLWREVGSVPVRLCQQYLVQCKISIIIYVVHVICFMCIHYILGLFQHRLRTADHAKTSVAYVTTAV